MQTSAYTKPINLEFWIVTWNKMVFSLEAATRGVPWK